MTAARFPTAAERERRARLIELLDEGKVLLQVAPRHPDVDLPPHLREELAVGLAISRNFGLSVLELGPLTLKANLSFHGQRYLCVVPWLAIFSMKSFVSDAQSFWPESVPGELLAGLALAQAEKEAEEPEEELEESEGGEPEEDPPEPPPTRPKLRIVK